MNIFVFDLFICFFFGSKYTGSDTSFLFFKTMFYFEHLQPSSVIDRAEFPWIKSLVELTKISCRKYVISDGINSLYSMEYEITNKTGHS